MLLATFDKHNVLLLHFRRNFLADGFSEFIHLSPRIASHFSRRHKKVVLINKHAVSGVEEAFHLRMKISYRLFAVLSGDVFLDVVHRSGAVKSHHDVYVVDSVGSKVHKCPGHAGAVQLESAFGFASREHVKSLFVIKGYVF